MSNLNQNVGNNFNLMFPPGRRKRRNAKSEEEDNFEEKILSFFVEPTCNLDL